MSKKVFLGMSGGVDSSVSAILLKEQGYDVTGIYMKNWSKDLPGMKCPWAEDLADAKRVAVQLDLDFEVWDFEQDYKQQVVDYMLAEFQKGRTPNPDIICNELIKFKIFYDRAMARGADFIATGHYARTNNTTTAYTDGPTGSSCPSPSLSTSDKTASAATVTGTTPPQLLRAVDGNKDQTYFLYRMSDEATAHTLFPVGHMKKPDVKALAERHGLDVAHKKESMGVCFVGEVGMKDFLKEYIKTTPGEIREQETDQVLGYHDGAILYTIGQRHGLYLGGGLPYYVTSKDLDRNIVYVSRNLNSDFLWTQELQLTDFHWRAETEKILADLSSVKSESQVQKASCETKTSTSQPLLVRLRHRGELIPAELNGNTLHFPNSIKRPAAGQSAVFYSGDICLGGAIIE